jgi:putative DNA primase/helicase
MTARSAIDFAAINAAALANGRTFLQTLIPGGKFRSLEYQVCNPTRDDERPGSFSINYKTGVWKDFATGEGGGDLISLCAYVHGISQGKAAREIADMLGIAVAKERASHGTAVPSTPHSASSDNISRPKVFQWGDAGPPCSDNEARRHTYKADGVPVAMKIKFRDGKFAQWYRVSQGWQPKKPDSFKAVPYVTEAIAPFDPELAGDQILWPEGERDVDSLSKLNLPAFTFGGVGDGLPNGIAPYLTGRHIVILADNDDAGRAHAERKVEIAFAAGAASVRVVNLPELPDKGDVSDFIEKGGTADELIARIDAAATLQTATRSVSDLADNIVGTGIIVRCASEIEPEPITCCGRTDRAWQANTDRWRSRLGKITAHCFLNCRCNNRR